MKPSYALLELSPAATARGKLSSAVVLGLALVGMTLTASDAVAADSAGKDRATRSQHAASTSSAAHASSASRPRDRARHRAVPQRQVGKASIYARKFANRKMADGQRMDPQGDNAASKTLPLGTRARVTNLETGKSAVVTIQDRGPYVNGRIVDLSPATAQQIGLSHHDGIATVEVRPLEVPPPRGDS